MWKKPNFFNISQANSLGEIWKNIPIFQKYVYQAKKKINLVMFQIIIIIMSVRWTNQF